MTITANPAVKEKCMVFILDLYISKLPVEAKEELVLLSSSSKRSISSMVYSCSCWQEHSGKHDP